MDKETYLSFFGLRDEPFRLTPDTRYFFPSPAHQGALEVLRYGLRSGEGFLVLTGEPGSGKTMILRLLMKEVAGEAETAVILSPTLSPRELIEALLDDLGLPYEPTAGKEKLIRLFQDHLLALGREGQRLVVVIDEAQNLPEESLEELRLLSNLEAEDRKLLQILLAGQPPLQEKLASPALSQLAQRISIWESIRPLTPKEIEAYVDFRMVKAGGAPLQLSSRALRTLHGLSRGLPRLVNKIMDRTLLLAASRGERAISSRLLAEAAETFGPPAAPKGLWQRLRALLWPGA